MVWLIAAVVCAALWGLVQTLDKLSVGRLVRYVPAYVVIIALVGAAVAAVQISAGVNPSMGARAALLSALSGILTVSYTYLFLKSLETLDAPEASTILLFVPVISTVLGVLLFGEHLRAWSALGISVIIAGAYAATRQEQEHLPHERDRVISAALLVFMAAFLVSGQRALEKHLLDNLKAPMEGVFLCERMAVLTAVALALMVLPGVRTRARQILKSVRPRSFAAPIAAEFSALAAIYTGLRALKDGPLGITNSIISASPVFALVLVTSLNAIRPQIIPDRGSAGSFMRRLAAILLTVFGIWLLSL